MTAGQGISGNLYDANYFNASNQVWNGSAFVDWDDDDFADYRTPMPETGTSGRFPLPAPPTNTTSWEMRIRGATLADSYVVWEGETVDLEAIKAKTDLIGSGSAVINAPVSGDGDLLELILETDYLAANGRALEWTFDEITGITASATGKFGLKDALTGTEVYVNSTGNVSDLGGGTFKVAFDIINTALDGLPPGKYDWSVEVLEGAYKITIARNRQIKTRVDVVEKQT